MNKQLRKLCSYLPGSVYLELNRMRSEFQTAQDERSQLCEENRKLNEELENCYVDKDVLANENRDLHQKLMKSSSMEDQLYIQQRKLEKLKKEYDEQKEILDSMMPGIKELVMDAIKGKMESGMSGKALYGMFSDADSGSWYQYPCLVKACEKLLGDEKIYLLYPEEYAMGIFGDIDPYGEMPWREKGAFGETVVSRSQRVYGFCDHEMDEGSQEYKEYRKALYEEAVKYLTESRSFQMFGINPSFFNRNRYGGTSHGNSML